MTEQTMVSQRETINKIETWCCDKEITLMRFFFFFSESPCAPLTRVNLCFTRIVRNFKTAVLTKMHELGIFNFYLH